MQAPATDPGVVNAPLFRRLLDTLSADQRSVILDLGSARPETLALFGRYRCRLDFADLAEGIDGLVPDPEDPRALRSRAEALLPPRRHEPVDVVLCWDLPNYLQRPALTTLMDCIAERARPRSLVHLMVVYSGTRMPARPSHYAPLPDGRLASTPATTDQRDAPRYSPEDLGRCLRGYVVEGAVLLRNGMQEFLFRL